MKKFCEYLRECTMKIINFKKKKNKIIKQMYKQMNNAQICYICKEKFENKYLKDKRCGKVKNHCDYTQKI